MLLATCLLGACGERVPAAIPLPGRLTATADPGGELLDAPARAVVCARDTTAAIVAVGDQWAGAVSMRVVVADSEPHPSTSLQIQPSLDRHEAAMVALRSTGDSLFAWVADSGSVLLDTGDTLLSGRFDVRARRDSLTIRLRGTFTVPRPPQACP